MFEHQKIYNAFVVNNWKEQEGGFWIEFRGGKKWYVDYEVFFNKIEKLEKKYLLSLKTKKRILDIGAGNGRVSEWLQKKGYDITALEKSAILCNFLAIRKIKKIIKADIFYFVPKVKFDAILYIHNYHIIGVKKDRFNKFLLNIKNNVLKKNGEMIFILHLPFTKSTSLTERRYQYIKNRKLVYGPWYNSLYLSPKDVSSIALKAGMSVVSIERDKNNFCLIVKNNSC